MKKYYSPFTLLNPRKLRSLLSFGIKGYLAEIGWLKAFDQRSPVDENGDPIPWVTYSFIDFIKPRLRHDQRVFEFGSGNSTLFYAKYCGSILSVEHDRNWFDKIGSTMPENSRLIYQPLTPGGSYSQAPPDTGERFDIIIVDGRDRVNCCKNSIDALSERGVIILDDSERSKYAEAIDFLTGQGFRHIAFSGISPGFFYYKSTSVFYRDGNCLGI